MTEAEIHEGWSTVRLGDLTCPSSEKIEPGVAGRAAYLSLEHIESDTNRILAHGLASETRSTKAVFRAGDILYGKLRPYLNKVAVPEFDGVCSTDVLVFPRSGAFESKYLMWCLSRPEVVRLADHRSAGTQMPRASWTDLAELSIPLPPLAEQRRIVEKVEALLARVGTARERLERVPKLLKRFRQAVLAAACEGRLTEGRIERDSEWEFSTFGNVLRESPQNGLYRPQSDYGSGTPIVRIDDFHAGRLKPLENLKRVRVGKAELRKFGLYAGDLLLNRVNSLRFLGKTVEVPILGEPTVFESNMMRCRVDESRVNPTFAQLYLMSPGGGEALRANAKLAVNQASINQGDVQGIPFPVVTLTEQKEIVRLVQGLFSLADTIEHRVAAALARAEKLPQAILSRAFAGELMPTEAELARVEGRSYETAEELLERIRTERAEAGKEKPRKVRRKGASRGRRAQAGTPRK